MIVDESKGSADVVNLFKNSQPDDSAFESFCRNLTFDYAAKPQRIARTILRRIEEKSHGDHNPLVVSRESLSLEHVIPKQPTEEDLEIWIGAEAIKSEDFDSIEFNNQVIKSIGNIVSIPFVDETLTKHSGEAPTAIARSEARSDGGARK